MGNFRISLAIPSLPILSLSNPKNEEGSMNKFAVWGLGILPAIVFLSGCVVRTYPVVKDRVDQEITGNQGYLMGSAPSGAEQPKKFTQRTTKVVEIELRNPFKFERLKEPPKSIEELDKERKEVISEDVTSNEGNRGYITGEVPISSAIEQGQANTFVDIYVVQKNDTLQKISARPEIYGTTKKWMKIYEANKDTLKALNKIYPGQKLKIPRD